MNEVTSLGSGLKSLTKKTGTHYFFSLLCSAVYHSNPLSVQTGSLRAYIVYRTKKTNRKKRSVFAGETKQNLKWYLNALLLGCLLSKKGSPGRRL